MGRKKAIEIISMKWHCCALRSKGEYVKANSAERSWAKSAGEVLARSCRGRWFRDGTADGSRDGSHDGLSKRRINEIVKRSKKINRGAAGNM